ncbi:MAG: hypothetical protein HYV26_13955 [Candidatus Hydrogenedentes bacterium]|nr:hypothetical protein [Candidatus Hydrogenedentota bacterium]
MAIKDAVTAFQEIHMYISGVLGVSANPTVTLSDTMIQAKHGFDSEFSFRKPAGKRGITRWR